MLVLGIQDELQPASSGYATIMSPSPDPVLFEVDVPMPTFVSNLYVHANTVGVDTDDIVFTVNKNGFPTDLQLTTTSSTQCQANTTDFADFAEGDRISISYSRPGGAGSSLARICCSVRFTPHA